MNYICFVKSKFSTKKTHLKYTRKRFKALKTSKNIRINNGQKYYKTVYALITILILYKIYSIKTKNTNKCINVFK